MTTWNRQSGFIKFWTYFRTASLLGFYNIFRVIKYRLGIKTGINSVCKLVAMVPQGLFFLSNDISKSTTSKKINTAHEKIHLLGYYDVELADKPPLWNKNILTGNQVDAEHKHWYAIPDFDSKTGDIKGIWEISRFDWVIAFALRASDGDENALSVLNIWLEDWLKNNKPYFGLNWKCGQEASFRVMHLAIASCLLKSYEKPSAGVCDLMAIHLQRIAPTIDYAIAQDNNHGTSEAAALFIGGSWLASVSYLQPQSSRWAEMGRKWLENRVNHLVAPDGSFSQYSVNYHRVLLDTLNMVEIWRRTLEIKPFSTIFYERACAATKWLYIFTDPENGDAPNIGANDSSRLFSLADVEHRDYRPSIELAARLFLEERAYDNSLISQDVLDTLDIKTPKPILPGPESRLFDNGGYAFLSCENTRVYLRYPHFDFRPGHADALHLDLWVAGKNILRDCGSYSYNSDDKWLSYFPGTMSHNTIQFDGRDQMPRIGRFLFSDWLQLKSRSEIEYNQDEISFSASYKDKKNASHIRDICLTTTNLIITDSVSGFSKCAVLRWHLIPGEWEIKNGVATNGDFHIEVNADVHIARCEIIPAWESRYYGKKTKLPVLEVEIQEHGELKTKISWIQ